MKKLIAVLLSLCVGVSFLAASARGGTPPPWTPWELEFEEYGRIFIMTPPHSNEICEEQYCEERMQIRSGLYYNTDPLVSIYYVDEYFFRGTLFFAGGGRYFARVHGTISSGTYGKLDGEAVSFFADGRRVRSYQVGDLVRGLGGVTITTAGLRWVNWNTLNHNQQAGTLSLVTMDGNAFTFDITTGEIIRQANRRLQVVAIGVGVLILTVAIDFVRRRRRIFSDRK